MNTITHTNSIIMRSPNIIMYIIMHVILHTMCVVMLIIHMIRDLV
jgi:hypothetical protein